MAILLLVLASSWIPAAVASTSTEGDFVVGGPSHFPLRSQLTGAPMALYHNDTANLTDFTAEIPRLRVRLLEWSAYHPLGLVDLGGPAVVETWWLHDARLEMAAGDASGILGVHPGASSILSLESGATMAVEPREQSKIGTLKQTSGETPFPYYVALISDPHLYMLTPGVASLNGAGALKIVGPDVRIAARENTTTVETGAFRVSPVETSYRWLELEFEQGAVKFAAESSAMEVAVREASEVSWDGPLQFVPLAGEIRTGGVTYAATGKPATLSGAFSATLAPAGGRAGIAELREIRGNLRAITLPAVQASSEVGFLSSVELPSSAWVPAVWIPVSALALGAGAILMRRRFRQSSAPKTAPRAEPPVLQVRQAPSLAQGNPLSTLLSLASEAEEDEDWRFALGSLQAARRLAPRDYGLAMREATCRRNLGDHKAALACYEEAALLRDTGEPYYWAAVLCVRTGNVTLAKQYAEAALARDPTLAAEFASDAFFQGICGTREPREASDN